ncbi:hypothetical protein NQZ68_042064 [Dissostichus eleginoides]|nr:hypothetical protein NQZ68_042064 [Dissostichus eleginoides]
MHHHYGTSNSRAPHSGTWISCDPAAASPSPGLNRALIPGSAQAGCKRKEEEKQRASDHLKRMMVEEDDSMVCTDRSITMSAHVIMTPLNT